MVNIYQAFMFSSAMECQCVCFFIPTPSSATNASLWKWSTTLHILVLSHFILSLPTRASTGMKTLKRDWLLFLFICKLEVVSVLFFRSVLLFSACFVGVLGSSLQEFALFFHCSGIDWWRFVCFSHSALVLTLSKTNTTHTHTPAHVRR